MADERLEMEGKLAQLEREKLPLDRKVERLCESIRRDLNLGLTAVEDLKIPELTDQVKELSISWLKLQSVNDKIDRLKRGLGHG